MSIDESVRCRGANPTISEGWRQDGDGQSSDLRRQRRNGCLETRTVFASGLSNLSGIEVGSGGVWLAAAPISSSFQTRIPTASPMDLRWSFWTVGTHIQACPITFRITFSLGPTAGSMAVWGTVRTRSSGFRAPRQMNAWLNAAIWRLHPESKNSKSWPVELAIPGASTSTPAESSSLRTTCWLTCGRSCPEADTNVGKSMMTTRTPRN